MLGRETGWDQCKLDCVWLRDAERDSRERESEREREKERGTETETERQRDRETERQRDTESRETVDLTMDLMLCSRSLMSAPGYSNLFVSYFIFIRIALFSTNELMHACWWCVTGLGLGFRV